MIAYLKDQIYFFPRQLHRHPHHLLILLLDLKLFFFSFLLTWIFLCVGANDLKCHWCVKGYI